MKAGRTNRQQGISLSEMMIAILLGSIITIVVSDNFTQSSMNTRSEQGVRSIAEGAQLAKELIARDLRMAGYQGCVGFREKPKADDAARLPKAAVFGVNAPAGQPDTLQIFNAARLGAPIVVQDINIAANAPEIVLGRNITVNEKTEFLITDCKQSVIFRSQATATTTSNRVVPPGTVSIVDLFCSREKRADPCSNIEFYILGQPGESVYSIAPSFPGSAGTSLFRGGVRMVDNITDLQVAYGLRSNGKLRYRDDCDAACKFGDAESLRFTITVSSPDQKIQRSFTTTVKLRNTSV
ncbi:prepilin-type N-terminal cleavage/methylation domain-containing protein [Endozoicomonas gorgoniicola]|uniref:Prepilin-type N-terminal cleavage/methylation domain-containing protein n=1 Tax=Endozoicomonas gorgoniicola TaxID=1234144 RepID=A0ABT3MXZ2_9GAMM|nr:prepilin-type N-terminal cleavage/methylation domain-containing protein [Endozoicomonas gorgoniicola]MCW7554229.1 prepilin-type N-terminal cleavage/methylation domain-containing protein [Endozoicomonas gorgoniicola]